MLLPDLRMYEATSNEDRNDNDPEMVGMIIPTMLKTAIDSLSSSVGLYDV